MAILQVLTGPNPGHQYTLDGERWVLGRHPNCDIVLDVGAVSRQHAQITRVNGEYVIEDLHSRNGTQVNGETVQGPRQLAEGDRVRICDVTLAYFRNQPSDIAPLKTTVGETSEVMALLVDDPQQSGAATIMGKLDVSTGRTGIRLNVNPEVKLRALVEITQNIGQALSVDIVLPKLLDSLFKIFVQADRGFVVMRAAPDGPLVPKAVKHRRANDEDQARLSRTIVDQVMTSKQAILSADAASDSRFQMSQSIADFRIRSMMCAPLVDSQGNALGVIQIDTLDQRSRFTQDDLDVLASVAGQAALALDNAQLHERALKQQAVQRDLELAHKVQQGLLPSAPPKIDGYDFFDFYEAANQVGGDYYDYIRLPGGRMGVVLADVSGKGVAAALLMARLSSEVRYGLASESSSAAAVSRINANFCASGWEDRFVTFVLALLDPVRHEVTLVNAGHMAPLLRDNKRQVKAVGEEIAGLPLGVVDDFAYEQMTIPLAPGSVLTMFTDGFSEAMNSKRELYGIPRLEQQLGGGQDDVPTLGRHILDDVRRFVGGHPQSDDMCLACFGRAK